MVKGVSKKIIEINNTQNAFFDKVVLYVRNGKSDYPQNLLDDEAKSYVNSLSGKTDKQDKKYTKLIIVLSGILFLLVGCGVYLFVSQILN